MIRVLLSGGMDSTACLAWALLEGNDAVECLFVSYGQRHKDREHAAASRVARHFGVRLWSMPLSTIEGSSLTGGPGDLDGAAVVVPNRNAIMLRQAAAMFPAPDTVVMGCCRDDWEVFEDCRPEFFDKMSDEIAPTRIATPVLDLNKRGVFEFAQKYGGTALLELTWSCYAGGDVPCEECGACAARARGMGR